MTDLSPYQDFLTRWRNCGLRLAWTGVLGREVMDERRPPRTSHYLFLAPVAGRLHITTGGRRYAVEPGEAILLPPELRWAEHQSLPAEALLAHRRVFFDVVTDHHAEHPLQTLLLPAVGELPRDEVREEWWREFFAAGRINRRAPPPDALVRARTAFDRILDDFLRRGIESGRLRRTATVDPPDWFASWLDAVMPDLRKEDLSLDQVIATSGFSRSRIYACFRRHLDTTPSAWVRERRIDLARKLLLSQRTAPVGTIATRCGYRDANLFARHFRAEMDCSPREWRKRHR